MRRYGLRDGQWDRIQDLLPGRAGHVGVTAQTIACLWKRSYSAIGQEFPGAICPGGSAIPSRFIPVFSVGEVRCLGSPFRSSGRATPIMSTP